VLFRSVVAQLSGDGVLSAYSRYLERLHGKESYYRRYRWSFALFNDPTVAPARPIDTASLAPLGRVLPRATVFGEAAFNQVYIRSGWGPEATFVSFRAGASFRHHGHYDAGHFTVFKGAPLAINSSLYGGMFAENRINYAMRTVAKNTLLILRPGETQRPNRKIPESFAAGGQRLTLPTGSALTSVADWRDNREAGLGWKAAGCALSTPAPGFTASSRPTSPAPTTIPAATIAVAAARSGAWCAICCTCTTTTWCWCATTSRPPTRPTSRSGCCIPSSSPASPTAAFCAEPRTTESWRATPTWR
jgi:hypothetical protein